MSVDITAINPTPQEQRNLQKLKRGVAISNEAATSLYRLGLCNPIQDVDENGNTYIARWNISDNGLRWLHYHHHQTKERQWDKRIAVAAIVISTISLIVSVIALLK